MHSATDDLFDLGLSAAEPAGAWESRIQQWAYKNGIRKDIRTLLTTTATLVPFMRGWRPVTLHEVIDDRDLKVVFQRALKVLHPDKNPSGSPDELYVLQRVVNELTDSFRSFRQMAKSG